MNAVEIEEAVTRLAGEPFDTSEFPFHFLEAFGRPQTTLQRLKTGSTNKSDIPGGVLQRQHIHIATCAKGEVTRTLAALKASPATAKQKAKFILATDGETLEAEDLSSGETRASAYADFANLFGFFLPLAGITTVKQVRDNPIDIQATARLNRLYVELLKENPDWQSAERRHDMNVFMTRLIFCFFAEDTEIFAPDLFTKTVEQMSDRMSTNTHEVIAELFRAMDTPREERDGAKLARWADAFPYVNGGLFQDAKEVPRFSRIARSYLIHAGNLDWKAINPDIFGSMIQAVAEDEERGELGLHYTSVPNILKVLNPLFLDDLRAQLEAAGDNPRKLLNLRKRIANIRVFDPACGSGNFLVIAYIQMREIEAEILRRRGEAGDRSWIKLENFYGIEIKDFAAEVARLSLLIAEFQCDVRLIGQKEARELVLPLKRTGRIHCDNALQLDWLEVCPPVEQLVERDLAGPTGRLALDRAARNGEPAIETYVCGNPPYLGGKKQSAEQKADIERIFAGERRHKNLDYVCGFVVSACRCMAVANKAALVVTNSINQGTHVPALWPLVLRLGCEIGFAYEPFKWANRAKRNAGVICTIIGLRHRAAEPKYIYAETSKRAVANISPYLVEGNDCVVQSRSSPISALSRMITGNAAYDGGHLFLTAAEARALIGSSPDLASRIRKVCGTSEYVDGITRYCLWFADDELALANTHPRVSERIKSVLDYRENGGEVAVTLVSRPHQFRYRNVCKRCQILIPQVSSERREFLPVGLLGKEWVLTHLAHAIYDPSLVDFSILSSRLHRQWVVTVCGKMKSDPRYSSGLGWNTFPVPPLTEKNKADLTRCAEDILLAREAHFPATIAELYDPEKMPDDLRAAHHRNDETLERIYIGRRFKNDTERLEKLFEMYSSMTAEPVEADEDEPEEAEEEEAS